MAARPDVVVCSFTAMVLDTEAQQRTMLQLLLEVDPTERGELPLREGRAIVCITESLEELHDSPRTSSSVGWC